MARYGQCPHNFLKISSDSSCISWNFSFFLGYICAFLLSFSFRNGVKDLLEYGWWAKGGTTTSFRGARGNWKEG